MDSKNFVDLLNELLKHLSNANVPEEIKFIKSQLKHAVEINDNWSDLVKEAFKHAIDDSQNVNQLGNIISACFLLQYVIF